MGGGESGREVAFLLGGRGSSQKGTRRCELDEDGRARAVPWVGDKA